MTGTKIGFVTIARRRFICGVALAGLAMPAVAFAQDAGEAQPATDRGAEQQAIGNEIVVTATKREQTLQDVPVAVSVTTAETIERAQIRDLRDLSSVVPSLRVAERQSSANTTFLIRGFGNGANNAGIEPSVGVFVDGVYRSRSAAQIGDLPDVGRVEVLRGPQSTLFGKNASAGIISIVTQKPKFDFGGNVEASYGNYNAVVLKGVVTGPLSETVAASLSAGVNKRDGYNRDLGTGERTNERDRWFARGQLLFEGDSGLQARLIADYGKIDEKCCGVVNVQSSPSTAALRALNPGVTIVNDPANRFGNAVYGNLSSTNAIENYGVSGQLDYDLGPLTFTSITALRKLNTLSDQDSDFTAADLIGRNWQDLGIRTFTQEFRAATNLDGPFNALIGAFYFNENVKQANQIQWGSVARNYANLLIQGATGGALNIGGAPAGDLERLFGGLEAQAAANPALATRYIGQFFRPGTGLDERYTLKNEAISLFAQFDFEIMDRLTFTGGVNWTHDKKRFSADVNSNDTFAGVNFNAPAYAPLRYQLIYQGALAQGATVAQATGLATANANNPAANPLNGLRALQFLPPFLDIPNTVESGRVSDSNVSYTARLAYDISSTLNGYISYATGYKGASVNLSRDSRPLATDAAVINSAGIAVVNQTYGSRFAGPENASVYEAGLKGNWGTTSANIAVFKQVIRGFQSNIFTGTGFFLANAGKQSTWGVEFEGNAQPIRGLSVGVGVTFLNPKYDSFPNSAFGDATGLRPSDIPSFIGTFSAAYDHELGNGDHVILAGDFRHESEVQVVEGLPAFVTKNSTTGAVLPGGYQAGLNAAKPFTREVNEMNASLTYAMQSGLELTVWGRNITNNRSINTIFDSPAQVGSISAYVNQPRTWGGSIRFKW